MTPNANIYLEWERNSKKKKRYNMYSMWHKERYHCSNFFSHSWKLYFLVSLGSGMCVNMVGTHIILQDFHTNFNKNHFLRLSFSYGGFYFRLLSEGPPIGGKPTPHSWKSSFSWRWVPCRNCEEKLILDQKHQIKVRKSC